MTTPLRAEGLTYRVEEKVLVESVHLDLAGGEVFGLVGPNGAGKSTLLRLLAGDLPPSEGEVSIDGTPIGSFRHLELARRRAVLSQQNVLQFAFRVLDVVLMGRYPYQRRGLSSRELDLRVAEQELERTDTRHLSTRRYPTLSGGEQTRVSLARVLTQTTPVILLDEPTVSLDVRHQELVMQVLRGLAAEGGAILTVLHDLNLAARYTDRLGVMNAARMVAVGPTADVLQDDLLTSVYEHPISVIPHPRGDAPLVLVLDSQAKPPPGETSSIERQPAAD